MRSLIILEVEHGEDTDSVQEWVEAVANMNYRRLYTMKWPNVTDYTVRVDVPPCFVLDSGS